MEVFAKGRSDKTMRAYRMDLDRFAAWMVDAPPIRPADWPAADVGRRRRGAAVMRLLAAGPDRAYAMAGLFRAHLRLCSPASTANRRLSCLRSVVKTAAAMGVVDWRLIVRPLAARTARDTRGPGKSAVRMMMHEAAAAGGLKGVRDVAILFLLYGLALRREEVVELDAENVDLKRPAVSVMGKGRDEREWLDLPMRAAETMAAWMAMRGTEDGPLFMTLSRAMNGERLGACGLYTLIVKLGKAVGAKATPHGIRHTAITDAILAGHPLPDVAKFSRHRDLRTLQAYYDEVDGTATEIAEGILQGM